MMRKLFIQHSSVFVLFLLSFVAIFPYLEPNYIIGGGESGFLIDPAYMNLFSSWHEKINFGSYSGFSANVFFYGIIWKVLSFVEAYIHPSVIWAFLAFFLPGLIMYFSLDSIFALEKKYFYLPSSILYSFNIFRLSVSYTNTSINSLFILLPLFFIVYYKFAKTRKFYYIPMLILLFLFSACMASNLAVFVIPYILLLFYFIFLVVTRQNITPKFLVANILFVIFAVVVNLYWIIPTLALLQFSYESTGDSLWNVINAGTFVDHLRFMGFWAFKTGYANELYFPYFKTYYSPLIIISTFLIVLTAFYHLNARSKVNRSLQLFAGSLAVVSLFMIAGAKGPFGFIYKFLFDEISMFKIFREPYAKFMPIYIFSLTIGLVFSLALISSRAKSAKRFRILFLILVLAVLVSAFPIFTQQAFYLKRWNEGSAGSVVIIPDYWLEAKHYLEEIAKNQNTIIFPHNEYVTFNNWKFGINIVGNVADYIIDTPFVKGWTPDNSAAGKILKKAYSNPNFYPKLAQYLGFINISYVLQENDLEWRYSQRVASPSETTKYLQDSSLTLLKEFGRFDREYLFGLANSEPNKSTRAEFYNELLNNPILAIYKVPDEYLVPQFYIPEKQVYVSGSSSELANAFSLSEAGKLAHYYFNDSPHTSEEVKNFVLTNATEVQAIGKKQQEFPYKFYLQNWDESWAWPEVSFSPASWSYDFVRLNEELQIATKINPRNKSAVLSWFAAKRIEELITYSLPMHLQQELIKDSSELNRSALSTIKQEFSGVTGERFSENWYDELSKEYAYFERGLSSLEQMGYSEIQLSELYDVRYDYHQFFEELRGDSAREDFVYSFDIPQAGNYELMLSLDGVTWEKIYDVTLDQDTTLNLQDVIHNKVTPLISNQEFVQTDISKLIKIPMWEPGRNYKITFDYVIRNGELTVSVLEDTLNDANVLARSENTSDDLRASRICLDRTTLDCYTRYENIVTSDKNSRNGYLYVQTPSETEENTYISIINLEVIEYMNPVFILRSSNSPTLLEQAQVPKLDVNKINPTLYKISIDEARHPYVLVFNQNFNENWVLTVDSNNQLREVNSAKHFRTNGFANAWKMDSEESNGQSNYDLVIEFKPQQTFYRFFFLSICVGLACALYLGSVLAYLLFKKVWRVR